MGRRPLDPVALLAKEPIGITRYGKCMYDVALNLEAGLLLAAGLHAFRDQNNGLL
jgi:hypothetical protein